MKFTPRNTVRTKFAQLKPGTTFRFLEGTYGVCLKLQTADALQEWQDNWVELSNGAVHGAGPDCPVKEVLTELLWEDA